MQICRNNNIIQELIKIIDRDYMRARKVLQLIFAGMQIDRAEKSEQGNRQSREIDRAGK